jgi:alkanesulfonate monooxygenase SsuD/methylene tetrahydromethanopterin reductase-like flavin-dependent oxidoreductase (luciferase family)
LAIFQANAGPSTAFWSPPRPHPAPRTKPVQKPHPPIIVRGSFPFGAQRALRWADGQMPYHTRTHYADVQALLPKFHEMATEAGRDPASVPITIWGAKENLDSSATATTAFTPGRQPGFRQGRYDPAGTRPTLIRQLGS